MIYFHANMTDFMTILALVGAAASAIACAITKLKVESVKCRVAEWAMTSILTWRKMAC